MNRKQKLVVCTLLAVALGLFGALGCEHESRMPPSSTEQPQVTTQANAGLREP